MTDEPEVFAIEPGEQVFENLNDAPVVFSNSARVMASAEDVGIAFGVRDNENPKTTHVRVKVYLTLPHAKRLAIALARSVQSLEEALGEIEANPGKRLAPEDLVDDERADRAVEGDTK